MCLERVPGFEPPPPDRSGLRVVKTERNSFTVVQVAAHSPAASAGFREGDLIVAINDRAAATLSYDDAFRLFRGLPGTRLTFDVIRASERMRLVVALRILSLPQ
jgi:carboxyl-terminal processing protease